MTFNHLLKLFKDNRGKNVPLSNTNDKYIIQVYDNDYQTIGNLRIKYCARVHILFHDDKVEITPCKKGECLYKKTKMFKLDEDIMKMKNLISIDFLNALVNYFNKNY